MAGALGAPARGHPHGPPRVSNRLEAPAPASREIVRLVETVHALEESMRIIDAWDPPAAPSAPVTPRAAGSRHVRAPFSAHGIGVHEVIELARECAAG